MNILMMTNTYLPHVGGVAASVAAFASELRARGHRVVVVAPQYDCGEEIDRDVVRIPAIQRFNHTDFSVVLPVPGLLTSRLKGFAPDVIHSHHPFLVGSTAVRIAAKYEAPIVYTQHTMFEQYTHYVPVRVPRLEEFVVNLTTGYANMADLVISPSESIGDILRNRGVHKSIRVVPTGVDLHRFAKGNGRTVRTSHNIGADAFVIGHTGRLAPEKNLGFLAQALSLFMRRNADAHLLIVGYGSSEEELCGIFAEEGLTERVHFLGKLQHQDLVNAYHAMDVFAFSSKSETQGLVLTEAMAAGVPVVALDAPGVREVVEDAANGYLVDTEDTELFAAALEKMRNLPVVARQRLRAAARRTARRFAMPACASRLIAAYQEVIENRPARRDQRDDSLWRMSIEQIRAEWDVISNITGAAGLAITKS